MRVRSPFPPHYNRPPMYAVISSGGKQERVAEGERVVVELLDAPVGADVELRPVLVVDGETVRATPEELAGVKVSARVVGEALGPKIRAMTYKPKTNQRRRWGHRQRYSTIEITSIEAAGSAGVGAAAGSDAGSD